MGYIYGNLNTTIFEEEQFYQYFGGRKIEYTGTLEISRKTDGITNLKMNDINIELDSTPIYYTTNENKILLPEDMAIVYPKEQGLMQKITHFSTIQLEDEIPYLQFENKKQSIGSGFLFDGNDLYIFLSPTTIKVGDKSYELSPLSYVSVTYRQTVEIYEKSTDKYEIIEYNMGDVVANTNDYEINLSADSLKYLEREQLLIKKVEALPNITWTE